MQTSAMIIDGQQVSGPTLFDVSNPATAEIVGRVANATPDDLENAVAAAARAFETWSATRDEDRSAVCTQIAQKFEEHHEELAQLLTAEQGKPLAGRGSRGEINQAITWSRHTSTLSLEPKVIQDDDTGRVVLVRKPLGVVGSILPWNAPAMIAVWHILPAIRSGNTVVVKPSPVAPLTVMRMVELMQEVLPPGVVNLVVSDDIAFNLGAGMSKHPDIAKIVFTGSIQTGTRIIKSAADTIKRLTLELGGNDAAIVLPDSDPKEIVERIFWGAFLNSGQTCVAIKRLYVHDDIYDDMCAELTAYAQNVPMGDGADESKLLGPLTTEEQRDFVADLVEQAKPDARVLLGGTPGEGLFYPATLVADIANDAALVQQEQFGPALPIIRFTDLDDAIAMANDNDNGLGASIWTNDLELARSVAPRFQSGSVWINKHPGIQPNAPFGGAKKSGLGVEFAEEGLAEYTQMQVLFS
ncbi:MAG: aldehyde dehydrogenase family protein [Proteobacteria bacterium]|nr:aldehyde dehydrogenase family protein [Pseudomonadota bacterium]